MWILNHSQTSIPPSGFALSLGDEVKRHIQQKQHSFILKFGTFPSSASQSESGFFALHLERAVRNCLSSSPGIGRKFVCDVGVRRRFVPVNDGFPLRESPPALAPSETDFTRNSKIYR
ncbi:hypothetical protein CEXT_747701 [Caerostris extrusa]|uniref:Uncharacterized protein n=1 Tax=Caerostris extrusa TaxID=172846 RepID=A0AAV4T7B0_CAEEX|nr:hypothetical protein CEXT_747701 [Caerostris extrusa]